MTTVLRFTVICEFIVFTKIIDNEILISYTGSQCTYRISAGVKVETDIITSIAASPIGSTMIQVIMYVETHKTDVIVFIGNIVMYFQYQS